MVGSSIDSGDPTMRRNTKPHYFTGFKHCGSQKVFLIEGQGAKSLAFTTYKSADNYRRNHKIKSHRIFSARYTIVAEMRSSSIH